MGSNVETISREDGFLGSYFEAKVLARVSKNKLKVEYLRLLCDDDESKMLKEVVNVADVRPCPPTIQVSGFDVLDKVDAFDNDGWWVGRVTGMSGCNNQYYVYFDSSGDEISYPAHKLRVHQEWEDGHWVLPHRKVC